jgi:hypothetical protein
MKIKCINKQCSRYLVEGEIYEPLRMYEEYYVIAFDNWEYMYNKSNFEVVEEKEVIKIKKWKDLDGVENDKYMLQVREFSENIYVVGGESKWDKSQIDRICGRETVFNYLKVFGFEVEFEEQIRISKELYYLCLAYPNSWVAVDEDSKKYIYNEKPARFAGFWSRHSSCEWFVKVECIPIPFTWDDEPINTNEIIRMYEQQNNTNI